MPAKLDQKVITLDAYEEGAVIEGLNKLRNDQLARGEDADFTGDVMLKIIETPVRKVKMGYMRSPAGVPAGVERQRYGPDPCRNAAGPDRSLRCRNDAR
jgi:hypothetical protein